jgi:hypothetical protein
VIPQDPSKKWPASPPSAECVVQSTKPIILGDDNDHVSVLPFDDLEVEQSTICHVCAADRAMPTMTIAMGFESGSEREVRTSGPRRPFALLFEGGSEQAKA